MEKQSIKKRITCLNIYKQLQTYAILLNEKLGQGYYGDVMKAYNEANQQEILAVKVIPFNGDKDYRATIEKEIDIIHALGDHPNLVKVFPVNCRSDHNYYIFMEYCDQGTFQLTMKQKLLNRDYFTQPQIFKTFYQILSGYKVLWDKKILHQDLKPENILIKKGVHKITDFGFSILYQGVKLGHKRQGTLEYMPIEKLTIFDYEANTKSDVYSLGVIFFKMITGRHPYILRPYEDESDFIAQLKQAELKPPVYIRARMSIPMQHLFDLIIKMVAKDQKQRIDFDQIYLYISEQTEFLAFSSHNKQNTKNHILESEEVQVLKEIQKSHSRFVEYSTAFAIPFSVMNTQKQAFEEMFRIKEMQLQEKKIFQTISNIENYLLSMRMIVYFFDRLTRRLTVQIKRQQFQKIRPETIPPSLELQERVIIYLVYLSLKITKQSLNESPKSSSLSQAYWTFSQWTIYKEKSSNVFQLIKNDQKYLEAEIQQLILSGKQQSKIKTIKGIIDESKRPLFRFMDQSVKPFLEELLRFRKNWICMDNKKQVITIYYILTAIEIIEKFEEKQQRWKELEAYFRETETKQISQLWEKVYEGLKQYSLHGSFLLGDWDEQQ